MPIDEVSVAALSQELNPSIVLIDVREVNEYESGHVPGAVNLPLSELPARISEVPNTTVYFICRSGSRSMQACEFCVDVGLTDVKNVAGGTMGWISDGNEIVLGGQIR